MHFKYLVVGAGLSGLTVAERIASRTKETVLVIEKRDHIGGNCYDSYNEDRILIQNYGPHTFHTSNQRVFDYLSQFTEWREYEHHVLSFVDGKFVPFPICLKTINELYGLSLTSEEMHQFIDSRKVNIKEIRNSEDFVLSQVGVELYEKFFKNFTIKQWGVSPKELDKSVISRLPFRYNNDTRYFTDPYQGQPKNGYTAMFRNMINNPNLKIMLNTSYQEIARKINFDTLIYTGPIDEYYNYQFGNLMYRSIRLEFETYDVESYQPGPSTRYPNDYEYTRVTEFKKMTGQKSDKTTILKEFPCFGGDPFYPYPTRDNKELYEKYYSLAQKEKNVFFVGRLGEYKYYNMDKVVERALNFVDAIIGNGL